MATRKRQRTGSRRSAPPPAERSGKPPGRQLVLRVNPDIGEVSASSIRPRRARWLYVLGHGAGAGMHHAFLEEISLRLARRQIATLRYHFPYMEAGRKLPDHARILQATVRAAMARARRSRLPMVVGGKSMGGRMTSLALADRPDPAALGLAFLGFPLHPAGKPPSNERAEHLRQIKIPALFIQGTRDALADLDRMRAVSRALGRRSRLHIVEGGDHSFDVLKRSGRTRDQVLDEIADALAEWGERFVE